jgi:dihydrodipicolinate reductase
MKVGLIGFGKTGKAVASILLQSHESISREAFGNGVLFAAQHLLDKPHGLYTMEDLLTPYFQLDAALPERRLDTA